MKVKIVNDSGHQLPKYETAASAGMDLRASIKNDITLKSLERALIPTGLYMELPVGYQAQVRPRSGLAAKFGITVLNTPGTIDADYRGEIKVILVNLSSEEFTISNGDRIAQMVIAPVIQANFQVVGDFEETERGQKGFGSSGVK